MKKIVLSLCFFTLLSTVAFAQEAIYDVGKNYITILPTDTEEDIVLKASKVVPSQRQYDWQKLELTAFIHFGVRTFDDEGFEKREADISLFNPEEIDVRQWVKVLKEAGMKLVVFTAKHSDGLCNWPSKCTEYNISKTPFQDGTGDLVRDLAEACKEAGLKFGVYVSPWDKHEPTFGTDAYNKVLIGQLTELLTNYGEISEVWFDGHGDGTVQNYYWDEYYSLIRKLQPNAVIAVMGPDVRWVGTESGYGRHTEWSVLPGNATNQEDIAAGSQQGDVEGAFVPRNLMDEDLGSREILKNAESLVWYPAEIDVSIRPGWFYVKEDDHQVKTPQKLVDIFYNSVGLNGVLLLNIAPDERGLIPDADIKSLKGMRYILDNTFNNNLVSKAKINSDNEVKKHSAKLLLDNNNETYWSPKSTTKPMIAQIELARKQSFNTLMLQENILEGQRIEKYKLDYFNGEEWETFVEGTTVGYKRLFKFPEVKTDRIRMTIEESRSIPQLSTIGVFKSPPEVSFEPAACSFRDEIKVQLISDTKASKIYYTLDGSIPTEESELYRGALTVHQSTTINALVVCPDNKKSLMSTATFSKANYSVKYNTNYSKKYPAQKELTLVDGVKGNLSYSDGNWQGFEQNDIDVVVDLGEEKEINFVSSNYFKHVKASVFAPEFVEYSFSTDGINFSGNIKMINENNLEKSKNEIRSYRGLSEIQTYDTVVTDTKARYVRVVAKNVETCPDWHAGAGSAAWLFVDEILIR
ncbi:alpha-L-fucosidase [uncultured Draconibacterium sp.]|uniref:alpha-L-fucosidase n=1 Tax=uncultured Draconibacterium sp. TaxID=1573823 RepID=UPI003260EBAA